MNQPTSDPPRPAQEILPGVLIEHFKVVRLLGQGGMGRVYLARDTRLGRKVALKVIRPGILKSADSRQRFLNEARLTARFNHPHIVTIFHVGQHGDCPFVALEYLEGQTLAERLAEQRPAMREALRLGVSIAGALGEAHRNEVLHRDLKPANVLLASDGRLRVLDFGLAKVVVDDTAVTLEPAGPDTLSLSGVEGFVTQAGGLRGSPAYMAPEQWKEQPLTPAADVWALGMILHELLGGRHPFQDAGLHQLFTLVVDPAPVPSLGQVEASLPDDLVRVVDRCVSKDPGGRPLAVQVMEALQQILDGKSARAGGEEENPFRGLLPFGERHAGRFFGRAAEVDAFMERLRTEPVLPVIGPSGAGKSSFVQAGVIPRLRELGPCEVLQLRPGNRPFIALARQLLMGATLATRSSGEDLSIEPMSVATNWAEVTRLAGELEQEPARLALDLLRRAEDVGGVVLLFVDQLEELFTLGKERNTAQGRRFMTAICSAADDAAGPARVIFTLRDDFLGQAAQGPAARQAMARVTVLRTPDDEALREILLRPVVGAGYTFEDDDLVEEMVAQVRGERAALPLLQFAGQELWNRRDTGRRQILRSTYEEIGGVAGALAHHSDGVIEGISSEQVRMARDIFLRLVTPNSTRAVVPRSQLLDGLGADAGHVLDALTGQRAILARKGVDEPELELVHESLITSWVRLVRWLDESREERLFTAEVTQAARLWDSRGRSRQEVWRGPALAEARLRAARLGVLPALARQFLEAGAEKAQQQVRRSRRRRRAFIGGALTLLALIALGATASLLLIRQQRDRAEEQRAVAISQRAASLQASASNALLRGDMLQARARLRGALELGDSLDARAIWMRLRDQPLRWKKTLGSWAYEGTYSPDGRHVAAGTAGGAIFIIDTRTGLTRIFRGHSDQIAALDYSPDGKRLASGSWGGEVILWDVETGQRRKLAGHKSPIPEVAFSPDGKTVASASHDGSVKLWDVSTGKVRSVLSGHRGKVRTVAYSPGGALIATGSLDGTARLWDPGSGAQRAVLRSPAGGGVASLDFSPDGKALVAASRRKRIWIWDVASRRRIVHRVVDRNIQKLRFGPGGKWIAGGAADNIVRLFDARTCALAGQLLGHTAAIYGLAFSPAGDRLASISTDRTVRLWDLTVDPRTAQRDSTASAFNGLAFSPDGATLASGSDDNSVWLWDARTGRRKGRLEGHTDNIQDVAFSPDGALLASASYDQTIILWDARTGRRKSKLVGHEGYAFHVAFSPDSGTLASASFDHTVRLWDVARGRLRTTLRGHTEDVDTVAFSPDGSLVASGGSDTFIRLWDPRSGKPVKVIGGHANKIHGLRFMPDSKELISSSIDHTIRRWDVKRGTHRITVRLDARLYWLDIHPAGKRVGVACSDGLARIWDMDENRVTRLRGHRAEVNYFVFSPDGALAATSSDDATVRLWRTDTGTPVWRSPLLRPGSTELYTHVGWRRLSGAPAWKPGSEQWRAAVAGRARIASELRNSGMLCLATHDEHLEIWDLRKDRILSRSSLPGLRDVAAIPGGCATLAAGAVRRHGARGVASVIRDGASAMAWAGDRLLVTTEGEVHTYGADGKARASHRADVRATAVGRAGRWLLVGYRDGNMDLVSTGRGSERPGFTFEAVPASPVVRIIPGPRGTIIAGYANGQVGMWKLRNGALLRKGRIYGPAVHLLLEGHTLYAASELGQHLIWDLGVFYEDYCKIMRQVWASVPILWEDGLPGIRKIPAAHRCAHP